MQIPIPRPWRIPAGLIVLSLVPFAATAHRLIWLSDPNAAPDPNAARFADSWTALVVHILCGSLFLILAAFQFSPELRARRSGWHRASGRIAVPAGLVAGLSGIWLILSYPPSALATPLMDTLRVIFGAALVCSLILAVAAIRRRDVQRHRAWMIRAFAIAVAGSTQALVIGLWMVFSGTLTPQSASVLVPLGFAVNLVFAEWRIRALSRMSPTLNPQRSPT